MTGFTTRMPRQTSLDPYKRVRYSLGMILGPDEFEQNLTYLMERDRLHQRSLHGYGTVCGLDVRLRHVSDTSDDIAEPVEIEVTPGIAVNPQGQTIRVPQLQCATVNDWLETNSEAIPDESITAESVDLYVVLCYDECDTDATFVPGDVCRPDDEIVVAARTADDFQLKLSLTPPNQIEENFVRRFGELLRQIRVSDEATAYEDTESLKTLLYDPESWDLQAEDEWPALPATLLYLQPLDANDALHELYRYWLTEVRPCLLPHGANGAGGPPAENCVLLAQLTFPIVSGETVRINDGIVLYEDDVINEEYRPILLHTRLLQEWVIGGGDLSLEDQQTLMTLGRNVHDDHDSILIWVHSPTALTIPPGAITIAGITPTVASIDIPASVGGSTSVIVAELSDHLDLSRDMVVVSLDGSQITDAGDSTLTLAAMADAGTAYIDRMGDNFFAYLLPDQYRLNDMVDVATAPTTGAMPPSDGDVLTWVDEDGVGVGRWEPQAPAGGGTGTSGPASGDLSGTYPALTVVGLQTRDVADIVPSVGEVLTWVDDDGDGTGQWEPRPPAAGSGGTVRDSFTESDLIRIVALSWQHGGLDDLQVIHNGEEILGAAFAVGRFALGDGTVLISTVNRHTFQVFVEMKRGGVGYSKVRLSGAIMPVRVSGITNDLIEATESGEFDSVADAFLLAFNGESKEALEESAGTVQIVIKGDFILEEEGRRAIDAEFVRATLPTGDRPDGSKSGIQGGLFESWALFKIDFNEASFEELQLIEGIGPRYARKIIDARNEEGPFTSINDLAERSGISQNVLRDQKELITI